MLCARVWGPAKPHLPPWLQAELTALAPELEKKSVETEELMKRLSVDQEKASEVSVMRLG